MVQELVNHRILHVVGESNGIHYAVVVDPDLYSILFLETKGRALKKESLETTTAKLCGLFGVTEEHIQREMPDIWEVLSVRIQLAEGTVILYQNCGAASQSYENHREVS